MAENKTRPSSKSVPEFLEQIDDPGRKADCRNIASLMEKITGSEPKMWGVSIVGFGEYHYKYASGREGDWFLAGFSPRRQSLTLYIMGYLDDYTDHLEHLGKYKRGKGCLYINKLKDIDLKVLEDMIRASLKE